MEQDTKSILWKGRDSLEEFGMKLSMFPKFINPYKYYWKLLNYIVKHFDSKTNPKLIEFESNIQNELNDSPTYLSSLGIVRKNSTENRVFLIDFANHVERLNA